MPQSKNIDMVPRPEPGAAFPMGDFTDPAGLLNQELDRLESGDNCTDTRSRQISFMFFIGTGRPYSHRTTPLRRRARTVASAWLLSAWAGRAHCPRWIPSTILARRSSL